MTHIATLGRKTVKLALASTPFIPAATPDDALAREAVAQVELDEFGDAVASFRRHGSYDGDESHLIALTAIRLARAEIQRAEFTHNRDSGSAEQAPERNQQ